MFRSHTCGELRLEDAGTQVTLAGWVQTVRKFGSITFVDLRDRYGITQLLFGEELKDVMVVTEDGGDNINGIEYISILKNSFEKGFSTQTIVAAGIAYGVFITVNNEMRNALCLITSIDGINWTEGYFLYKIIDGKCVWE